jgi:hypothetical protein
LVKSCFGQIENPVQKVAAQVVMAQVVMAVALGINPLGDFVPLKVRQVGAIVFAHSFGSVFGEKDTHHRKRGGLPFVYVGTV